MNVETFDLFTIFIKPSKRIEKKIKYNWNEHRKPLLETCTFLACFDTLNRTLTQIDFIQNYDLKNNNLNRLMEMKLNSIFQYLIQREYWIGIESVKCVHFERKESWRNSWFLQFGLVNLNKRVNKWWITWKSWLQINL